MLIAVHRWWCVQVCAYLLERSGAVTSVIGGTVGAEHPLFSAVLGTPSVLDTPSVARIIEVRVGGSDQY